MTDTDALRARCGRAQRAADTLLCQLLTALRIVLRDTPGGESRALQLEQARAHGVAWAATYVHALQQTLQWAQRLQADGRLGDLEQLLLRAAHAEYLAQLAGGLPMSQGEMFRGDTLDAGALAAFNADADVRQLRAELHTALRRRIVERLAEARPRSFSDGFRRCGAVRVRSSRPSPTTMPRPRMLAPAQRLIPDGDRPDAHLGVFGLTMGEMGGAGMGKWRCAW